MKNILVFQAIKSLQLYPILKMEYAKIYLKVIFNVILILNFEAYVAARIISTMQKDFPGGIQGFSTLPYEDCGSLYDINFLHISGCSRIPCEMLRGSTVSVQIIFDDNGNDTKFLRNHVSWVFNAVKTNALITPEPCDGNVECISTFNDKKSYRSKLLVNNNLPIIRGVMRWEAVNEYDNAVLCFKVPVTIRG